MNSVISTSYKFDNLGLDFEIKICMKTNLMQIKRVKLIANKLGLLMLFSLILVLNEGCQNQQEAQLNWMMQDRIRKNHTLHSNVKKQDRIRKNYLKELLSANNGVKTNPKIHSFEGDAKFSHYIVQYLKNSNNKMNAESFTETLMNLSRTQAYDPIFILAVAKTESDFNFNAIGSAGEVGLMQIKPVTAQWICNRLKIEWKGAQALKDPEYNILVGAYYFKYLKKVFKSQSLKYINAYNMGLGSLKRMPAAHLKKHPYFGKVTANYLAIYAELNKIKENQKMKI